MRSLSYGLVVALLFCTSCTSNGYLARRGRDLADVLAVTVSAGPELSVDVQATDLFHLGLGGGAHVEAGFVGRRVGTAGMMTLGLPFVPFIEDGVLYGRYVFSETGGAWRLEDVEDECYIVHFIETAPTHPKTDAWHALDLELGFTALVGARVGFHPGELVDFLAGLVGLDPIGDDPVAPPLPPESE
jgi:hypothetical protein